MIFLNTNEIIDIPEEFDESIRVDREAEGTEDPRLDSIEKYHLTEDSREFLEDFILRLLGRDKGGTSKYTYWLYGYYGSGKSHLLKVTDGLMSTSLYEQKGGDIWRGLTESDDGLRESWEEIHDEYHVIPISVNLLKHQGQKERSFSEIVLEAAHQSEDLTGVGGGLSPRLDVAYFEDWYRTTGAWENRNEKVKEALSGVISDPEGYDWKDVQEYGALADVVLPRLFEEEMGTRDGFEDLQPSDIRPERVIDRLDELRSEREDELDKPVKLVLLLDEVSLFMGSDFGRLTELQTLAENTNETGDGDIHLVVTAQDEVEEVQPKFASKGADVGILKDRFPHRPSLPSKHVGEIAEQRLLRRPEGGEEKVQRVLDSAEIEVDSLSYKKVNQDLTPTLKQVDEEQLRKSYPFLPYQPPLFLEILYSLRHKASDPAKSIFSGTARAILAVMHGLLEDWQQEGDTQSLISISDFYDKIAGEDGEALEGIVEEDARVVEEVKEEFGKDSLEALITKSVFLLRYVNDTVPLNDENLAVSVTEDLSGPPIINRANEVREALNGMQKYVRESESESEPAFTITTSTERTVYEDMEDNREVADNRWEEIVKALDESVWLDTVGDLSLPDFAEYRGTEEDVRYTFEVDGTPLSTTVGEEDSLRAHIEVVGLVPQTPADTAESEDTLYLEIEPDAVDGLENLRGRILDWWSLYEACPETVPKSIRRDLKEREENVRSGLVETLRNSEYVVKGKRVDSMQSAVSDAIESRYPDEFHPRMLSVDEDLLSQLKELDSGESLPEWANDIGVPTVRGGNTTIANNIRAYAGRQLKDEDSLSVASVLDGIVEGIAEDESGGDEERKEEIIDIYEDVRPAICAVLWGLCRTNDFLPVDEDGGSLSPDAVLDLNRLSSTRLRIGPGGIRDTLEEQGFRDSNETVAQGISNLEEANDSIRTEASSVVGDIDLVKDDVYSDEITSMLQSLQDALKEMKQEADDRNESVAQGADADWEKIISETREAKDRLSEIASVWDDRQPYLHKFDALLAVESRSPEWLDNADSLGSLRDSIEEGDEGWWTEDGWSSFAGSLDVSSATDSVFESWDTFVDENSLSELVSQISDHSWIVEPTELPSSVGSGFERMYITPLRRLEDWYEDLSGSVDSVASDVASAETDTNDLIRAAETFSEREDLEDYTGYGIKELEERYDKMTQIIGDRELSDVEVVGVVPDDREVILSKLESAGTDSLSLSDSGEGVLVQ